MEMICYSNEAYSDVYWKGSDVKMHMQPRASRTAVPKRQHYKPVNTASISSATLG